ncbi:MAG: sugar ABC transporter ATP-binding protein, partial [Synergistaceae bacterium]|nr:sugar ABC transporter ATP-binding protein [Synergistaceae bacterium]
MSDDILTMSRVTKTFPGVMALSDVTVSLREGEILALVGENGAGKSTLMKILGGVYQADEGEFSINGEPVKISSPLDAQCLGISIIYQEVNLVPTLSVAENIFLGSEATKGSGIFKHLDRRAMGNAAREILSRLECVNIDVYSAVQDLSIAKRQLVEIAKALKNKSRILVMDEPTSSLSEGEAKALFAIAENLKKQGISIIYISHRLEEVQQICDRVIVLRDGKFASELDNTIRALPKAEIVRQMVGRDLTDFYPAGEAVISDDEALRVSNLSCGNLFRDVSFALHKGEIVGMAGLVGAGRTEVAKTIFGEYRRSGGEIRVGGKPLERAGVEAAVSRGVTLIPEDRKGEGLVLIMSLAENICLPNADKTSARGIVSKTKMKNLVGRFVGDMNIRPAIPERAAIDFSGGNQQKAVIAKWLAKNPVVLIMDEPTRGVDIGAKCEIYSLMRNLTKRGVGILFISSEMPEL